MNFITYIITALMGSAIAAGILTLFVGVLKRHQSETKTPSSTPRKEYEPEPAGAGFAASVRH